MRTRGTAGTAADSVAAARDEFVGQHPGLGDKRDQCAPDARVEIRQVVQEFLEQRAHGNEPRVACAGRTLQQYAPFSAALQFRQRGHGRRCAAQAARRRVPGSGSPKRFRRSERCRAVAEPTTGRLGRNAEFVGREVIDIDEVHDLAVVLAQHRGFGFGDDARARVDCVICPGRSSAVTLPVFCAFHADALFDRFGHDRKRQRFLQQAERVGRFHRLVDAATQPVARLGRIHDGVRNAAAEAVARREVGQAAREDQQAHQAREKADREIAQKRMQLLLRVVQQMAAAPLDDRQTRLQGSP